MSRDEGQTCERQAPEQMTSYGAGDVGRVRLSSKPVSFSSEEFDDAAAIIADVFVDNRLEALGDPAGMRMQMRCLRLGSVTVGLLGLGAEVRLTSAELENFHLNTPISGRARYRYGNEPEVVTAGSGLVFSPGEQTVVDWSRDCVQLCLMVPAGRVELAIEQTLGRQVRGPVVFDLAAGLEEHVARQSGRLTQLLTEELESPTGLASNRSAGAHLESLVLDSLVLDYQHNYSEDLFAPTAHGSNAAIRRAVGLIEEAPEYPWTVVELASRVHLSPRALQEGFHKHIGQPPMSYLRQVRLRRVHEALLAADAAETSVRALAFQHGFLHLGRFAGVYRHAFGMLPSETLRQDTSQAAASRRDVGTSD
jgi:AraC-like DNA-binding protein